MPARIIAMCPQAHLDRDSRIGAFLEEPEIGVPNAQLGDVNLIEPLGGMLVDVRVDHLFSMFYFDGKSQNSRLNATIAAATTALVVAQRRNRNKSSATFFLAFAVTKKPGRRSFSALSFATYRLSPIPLSVQFF
jgi:hypothetical protein